MWQFLRCRALPQVFDLGADGREAAVRKVAEVSDFKALAERAAGVFLAQQLPADSRRLMVLF